MSVAMEKFMHTPQTPVSTWSDLENGNKFTGVSNENELLKKIGKLVAHKSKLILMITCCWIASILSSCGWDNSVDEEIESLKKKRETEVSKLEKEKEKVDAQLEHARTQLIKAKNAEKATKGNK